MQGGAEPDPADTTALSGTSDAGGAVGIADAGRRLLTPVGQGEPDVEVRLLGSFEVRLDGRPVRSWGGGRIRTAFQYLVLHDRPVRREALMDLMWPGHTYASARNNLNVCLYGLRRTLGARDSQEYVVYREGCYGLNHDVTWSVDAVRFADRTRRMRTAAGRGDTAAAIQHAWAAVGEYRGGLLEGEPSSDWCSDERTALAEQFLRTLQRAAELEIGVGDLAAAERAAERLLREDPCREAVHRLLMVCYARGHQLDLVARQFRRCVAHLGDELEIAPSAETVRLYRELTCVPGPRSTGAT